jgi:hypothetical protein
VLFAPQNNTVSKSMPAINALDGFWRALMENTEVRMRSD